MHALQPRPAQCLRCFACLFYGHNVRYGFAGAAHAGLKKEMGLRHVSGDYNHRKQEYNCLQYAGSRKCTTQRGQEGGGAAEGGAEWETAAEKFVNEEVEEDNDESRGSSAGRPPFTAARPEPRERRARLHAKGQKRVLFAG